MIYDKNEFEINGNQIKVKENRTVNFYFKYQEKKPFQKIMKWHIVLLSLIILKLL